MKYLKTHIVWVLGVLFLFTACPEETPPRDTTIHLSLRSASTFSVLLNVSVEDSSDAWTFALSRNDSIVQTVVSNQPDTTIRDGGLLPGHDYRYKAYWLNHGDKADSSEEVLAATLDTTSHNFTWEIDTLGNYGSYLNDVWIVDENNIWVVGNIETDSGEYNAARWDGEEWELMVIINTADLYSIWYFNENDIWVTKHSYPVHWDGTEWTQYNLTEMGISGSPGKAIWASSPDDIYFVGDNGSIVHYDGSGFERMESGTDVDLHNVVGTDDGQYVFSVGYDDSNGHSIILENNNNGWNTLYYNESVVPQSGNMGVVYDGTDIYNDTIYFAMGAGIWKYNYQTEKSRLLRSQDFFDLLIFGSQGLSVHSLNDISTSSGWAELIHFNGYSWKLDTTVMTEFGTGQIYCYGMDQKGEIIVLVGHVFGRKHALVARGIHN